MAEIRQDALEALVQAVGERDRLRELLDEVEAERQREVSWQSRAEAAEAKLAAVARVRDWMGENNDDAEYDLVIVALNNILEGGDRD